MKFINKRNSTRSLAWPDTGAIITAVDSRSRKSKGRRRIKGRVRDIGSCGMFLETSEYIPVNSTVDIEIQFDPACRSSTLPLNVRGQIVHATRQGLGIRFISIDLSLFQRLIVQKMNRMERQRAMGASG